MKNKSVGVSTPEQIAEWKSKYSKVFTITSEDEVNGEIVTVIAKKPSRASFERYQDEIMKKGVKSMQQFVMENVLHPERAELVALFEDKPGLISGIATHLQDVMGVSVGFTMTEF